MKAKTETFFFKTASLANHSLSLMLIILVWSPYVWELEVWLVLLVELLVSMVGLQASMLQLVVLVCLKALVVLLKAWLLLELGVSVGDLVVFAEDLVFLFVEHLVVFAVVEVVQLV